MSRVSKKINIDVSEPYGETVRGNLCIVSFEDWLNNCPDALDVPDKMDRTEAYLMVGKFYPGTEPLCS